MFDILLDIPRDGVMSMKQNALQLVHDPDRDLAEYKHLKPGEFVKRQLSFSKITSAMFKEFKLHRWLYWLDVNRSSVWIQIESHSEKAMKKFYSYSSGKRANFMLKYEQLQALREFVTEAELRRVENLP